MRAEALVERLPVPSSDGEGVLEGGVVACCADDDVEVVVGSVGQFDAFLCYAFDVCRDEVDLEQDKSCVCIRERVCLHCPSRAPQDTQAQALASCKQPQNQERLQRS